MIDALVILLLFHNNNHTRFLWIWCIRLGFLLDWLHMLNSTRNNLDPDNLLKHGSMAYYSLYSQFLLKACVDSLLLAKHLALKRIISLYVILWLGNGNSSTVRTPFSQNDCHLSTDQCTHQNLNEFKNSLFGSFAFYSILVNKVHPLRL